MGNWFRYARCARVRARLRGRRLILDQLEDRCLLAGSITEYTGLAANGAPLSIAAGPDGALWFTEPGSNKIGRVTTTGSLTQYAIPSSLSLAASITAGPDRRVWFTEPGINKIGRVTTSGVFTQYAIPSPLSLAASITAGPDGAYGSPSRGSTRSAG